MKKSFKIIFLCLPSSVLFLLTSVFCPSASFSQTAPAIQWQKCLGGTMREDGESIQQTNDGGYIAAGFATSTDGDVTGIVGGSDYWVVKLDNISNIQWQKSLGGSGAEWAFSICQTIDQGYIIGGFAYSNDGNVTGNHSASGSADYWVVKLDSAGSLQWQKCLGGTQQDQQCHVIQTSDSGYFASGYTSSNDSDVTGNHGGADIWAVKLDTAGNMQWQKCYGGSQVDNGFSLTQTSDAGYILAGGTLSSNGDVSGNHGNEDVLMVKIDTVGTLQWQKCLGGTLQDRAHCIKQTFDNGYIVTGKTKSDNGDVSGNHGGGDAWIIKTDSAGNIQWQKCLGGTDNEEGNFVIQTLDSGYIVAGFTGSNDGDVTGNHGSDDYWILKVDMNGNLEWQKCLGGTNIDIANCVRQTSDSGYIINGISISNDGDVSGNHDTLNGTQYLPDYWVVKLGPDTLTGIPNFQLPASNFQFSPNPLTTQSKLTFKNTNKEKFHFTLYDITGRVTESVSTTANEIILTKGSKQPGVYLFNLMNEKNGERWNGKIVVSD